MTDAQRKFENIRRDREARRASQPSRIIAFARKQMVAIREAKRAALKG